MTEKLPAAPTNFDEVVPFLNEEGRNDRFTYAKVRRGDEWFFLKTARTPELQDNLRREFIWAEFMEHVASRLPDAKLRAPRMIGFEPNGGLLMEYINAPHVARSSDLDAWKSHLDRYAKTLAVLDECADGWETDWPDSSKLAGMQDIDSVWRRWLGDNEVAALPQAKQRIEERMPHLTMRIQHGDLTPWQMFVVGDEWVIYDGEKAGNHLPRYNDLAYGYGRLYTRLQDRRAAADLLNKFLEYSNSDYDEFFKDFLPIMTFRAVGMIGDAYHDPVRDYLADAEALLDQCLDTSRLSDFTDPR